MYASAHTAEQADPPERPQPLPRPGVEAGEPDTRGATPDQIAAFFGRN
jgi:hypothetical protein